MAIDLSTTTASPGDEALAAKTDFFLPAVLVTLADNPLIVLLVNH